MGTVAVLQRPEGRGALVLRPEVVDALLSHAQRLPGAPEAGGVLIGGSVGPNVLIERATTPFPEDVAGLLEFNRLSKGHEQAVIDAWETSGGLLSFWGDWHTHPQANPEPSPEDIAIWKRQTAHWTEVDQLFYIIVGTEAIRVWEMDRATLTLTELSWE